jgi:hypothetical protein
MQSPFHEEAPHWAPSWNVLAEVGKRPIETGWPRWCYERQPAGYVGHYTRSGTPYNIGLPLGQRGLVAIDIDTDDPAHIAQIIACLPPIRAAKRGKRGFTAFFLTDGDRIPTQRLGLVEVLSHGTQTVIPPSIHPDTGEAYVWLDPQALEV